ncbi:MAG: hypothetical protein ACFFD1_15145, partial [Candidatus Thorarchaeota archaeon]
SFNSKLYPNPGKDFLYISGIENINKKSRARIITNLSTIEEKTLEKLYKKRGNVSVFEVEDTAAFLLILGESTGGNDSDSKNFRALLAVYPEDKDQGTPGFIISNKTLFDFFDKTIIFTILKSAKTISREK